VNFSIAAGLISRLERDEKAAPQLSTTQLASAYLGYISVNSAYRSSNFFFEDQIVWLTGVDVLHSLSSG